MIVYTGKKSELDLLVLHCLDLSSPLSLEEISESILITDYEDFEDDFKEDLILSTIDKLGHKVEEVSLNRYKRTTPERQYELEHKDRLTLSESLRRCIKSIKGGQLLDLSDSFLWSYFQQRREIIRSRKKTVHLSVDGHNKELVRIKLETESQIHALKQQVKELIKRMESELHRTHKNV